MGCDIHLYREKKVNGIWVSADSGWDDEYNEGVEDVPYENRFSDRDYNLFGFLCKGVRRDFDYSLDAKGFPDDACEEVRLLSDSYGCNGHSHSTLTISELNNAWAMLQELKTPISGMMEKDQLKKLEISLGSESPDYNLIYPYCQHTNCKRYVSFNIDIPASYVLSGVKTIIDSLNDVDGDDQRVVFWFDN